MTRGRLINRVLQRVFPKTFDIAVRRIAAERGISPDEVRAKLGV